MTTRFQGYRWPTDDETLLLRAALLKEGDASTAWLRWRQSRHLDGLTGPGTTLLPLIYQNLRRQAGEATADLPRLKGIYKRSWYANTLLTARAAEGIGALTDAGVETIVLKGAALGPSAYHDTGVRPMDDVDVLIHRADARTAERTLRGQGWFLKNASDISFEGNLNSLHACLLGHKNGGAIDLHWYALKDCPQEDADADFWRHSRPFELGTATTRMLNLGDQLLHVCAHGLGWDARRSLLWIADAATVLRGNEALDWERLEESARDRHLAGTLARALEYVGTLVDFDIPPGVLTRLEASSSGWFDGLERRVKESSPTLTASLLQELLHYRNLSAGQPFLRRLRGLGEYNRNRWGLTTLPQTATFAVQRLRARLSRQGG